MTSAIAVPTNSSIPPFVSSVREIPLIRISESQTNPRRLFDEIKLAELADNIRQHGVLQPVLVRPLTGGEPDTFELVAGARRYRASKLAGRETIPASVRETDRYRMPRTAAHRELATRRTSHRVRC